jgi:hypothetical protein
MAPTIILAKDFNINNVTFSDVKMLDNGGKIVYVSYNKSPFLMQTPKMKAPFGLSMWDNDGKNVPKYTLDLSFGGMDSSPQLQAFYEVLENMDVRMVNDGFDNQQSWFKGKKYGSREIVEALYTPIIKYAKDKNTGERSDKYPPTMKLNVPFRDGTFACDAFDDNRKPVNVESIETKGSFINAIIQCTGVWFAGGKFGVSWKVVQMKYTPASMSFMGQCAFRDDDNENGDGGRRGYDADVDTGAARVGNKSREEHDSEEDEEDEDEDRNEISVEDTREDGPSSRQMTNANAPEDDDDVDEPCTRQKRVSAAPTKKKVYTRSK